MKRQPITVYVEQENRDWLETLAKREGRSVSNIVTRLITESREREDSHGEDR